MFTALERELQRQQLSSLRTHDDRLAHLSELDQMEIWAGDGHCIAHNLLRLFTTKLKTEENIEDSKVIRAWQKDLVKRAEKARAAGRTLPVKLYQALYRSTEVSLQFIRWLRVGLMRPTCYSLAIEGLRPLMQAYL